MKMTCFWVLVLEGLVVLHTSCPIDSWQIDAEIMETVRDFLFGGWGGSKITADGDWSHEVNPLDCKEIQPVHPKGSQSWIFIGGTGAEAKTPTPVLWPLDVNNWLNGKDPDVGKDWRWEEKGMTEDEMVGCHHQLNEHEFEQASRVGHGQWSLVCCSPWGRKVSEMTERLNSTVIYFED